MSEKKEEKKVDKKDLYFGFLPKTEVPKFIENFKKGLGEGKKEGEKKLVEVKINGTNDDPKGIAFELGSFGEKDYNLMIDDSQPYMKDALLVFTLSIGVGDPSVVPAIPDRSARRLLHWPQPAAGPSLPQSWWAWRA